MTTQVLITTEQLKTIKAALRNWCALYPGMVDALDQRATDILDGLQAQQPQAEPSDEDIAKLHDSMFPSPYGGHASVIKFSRALLAMRQQPQVAGVPDGFVLVPVEPTEEMIAAGKREAHRDGAATKCVRIYRAMLSATPPHPATAQPDIEVHQCGITLNFGKQSDCDLCNPTAPAQGEQA